MSGEVGHAPTNNQTLRGAAKRAEMISKCWLHIGTEKTGTTSIQEFLAANRMAMQALGYLYPVSPGRTNHVGLACYAQKDNSFDSTRRSFGLSTPDKVVRYRVKLEAALDREISESDAHTIIFSNEHLSSRLATQEEVRRIKDLCARYAEQTSIIVYLRNQVDFLVSRYIEAVKGGNVRSLPFPVKGAAARLMNYDTLLAPWRDNFGYENLVVRRFETEDFHGGDLLLDFESRIGIPSGTLSRTERSNQALSMECVEFLRRFNRYVPHLTGGRRSPGRANLVKFLEQFEGGRPFQISPVLIEQIEGMFRESNENVSRTYFNSRYHPLFPGRTNAAQVQSHAADLELGEAIRIAAHLWTEQQRELQECKERLDSTGGNGA